MLLSGTLHERGLLNHLPLRKSDAGDNSLQQSQKGSAQRYELPLFLRKHLPPSWCKHFPFCFLCPVKQNVNSDRLEDLRCSAGETADPLLKPGAGELEIKLELEPAIINQGNSENHKCGKPLAHEMLPQC